MRFKPEVRGKEVVVDAPLPDTQRGRDAATMIRNGTMTGLSIEFRATDEGRWPGVSARSAPPSSWARPWSTDPSYEGALEVRERGKRRRLAVWL